VTIVAAVAVVSAVMSILAGDWLAGAAIWILWAAWRILYARGRLPVIAMAFTFQWVQVVAGIMYYALTGRTLPVMYLSDYREMVIIGLGCLVALLVGLWIGLSLFTSRGENSGIEARPVFSPTTLIIAYVAVTAATGTIQQMAWEVPALTQGILALTLVRLALVFLVFERLTRPRVRWGLIAVVVLAETALGFTGQFAGFREPLILAGIALIEVFDTREVRHWVVLGALAIVMLTAATTWMAVRAEYRRDLEAEVMASRTARLESIASLSAAWLQSDPEEFFDSFDSFVDRLWTIYYPALAVARVPAVVPHEDGAILSEAVLHLLTPRLLFPDKGMLRSDSEMVRHYSGVHVAGIEQGTSIAFGYAAESYVDFGIPLMFLPVLVYGAVLGATYRFLLMAIRHRELAVAVVTVVLWQSLYSFERSWARHLGLFMTLTFFLGGGTILADRILLWRERAASGTTRVRRMSTPVGDA